MGYEVIAYWVITALLTIYQISEAQNAKKAAKRARQKAEEEADARKGYELVVEGEIAPVSLVYGRAKVGGVRAWHKIQSNFEYANPNSDKFFLAGGVHQLNQGHSGSKNQMLIFQQAITVGPIKGVKTVILENDMLLDDTTLNADSYESDNLFGALRIDVHNNGGVPDNIAVANDSSRRTSKFIGVAYATVSIRMRRDDPVFTNVPQVQFLVEGRTIRSIIKNPDNTYSVSGTRSYSNNNALCLLDYLLDFKKVALARINLETFYDASLVCDKQVFRDDTFPDFAVGGLMWQPTYRSDFGGDQYRGPHAWQYEKQGDGTYLPVPNRGVTKRHLTVYECNCVIDLKKSHRENVNTILDSMGDAKLVWSQGKYKLLLQYPGPANENIIVSGVVTDDDLVLGKDITIAMPSIDERYNSCTISFPDESRSFKTNTVTWPPKESGVFTKGVDGKYYLTASGWDNSNGGLFMGRYAIRSPDLNHATFHFKIIPLQTGPHKLEYLINEFGYIKIGNLQFNVAADETPINVYDPEDSTRVINSYTDGTAIWMRKQAGPSVVYVDLVINQAVDIEIYTEVGFHDNALAGAGARLEGPDGIELWTTRDCAYIGYEDETRTADVYNAMLAEDHGLDLSADMSTEGITDEYHAMAKAETAVRTSRSAARYAFTCYPKEKFYEPGDIIQIKSETLQVGAGVPVYLRVQNLRVVEGDLLEYQCVRFDGSQLAWNVNDNKYPKPPQSFDGKLYPPLYLTYFPPDPDRGRSAGYLDWPEVGDARVVAFRCYYLFRDEVDENGNWILHDIGSTTQSQLTVPELNIAGKVSFAVRSVSSAGAMSEPRYTNDLDLSKQVPLAITDLVAHPYGAQSQSVNLTWTIPTMTVGGVPYTTHILTNIYRSRVNDRATAIRVGETLGNNFIETPQEYGQLYYWAECQTYAGLRGAQSNAATILLDYWTSVKPPDTGGKPPLPTNVQAFGSFSSIRITWERPVYEVGGGHLNTLIYATPWPTGAIEPAFSEAYLVATVDFVKMYRFLGEPGVRYIFWLKEQAKSLAISDFPTLPVSATCDLVGSEDLQNLIIELRHMTKDSVGSTEITEGAIKTKHMVATEVVALFAAFNQVWIEDAWIRNLDAAKITSGYIGSDVIEAGSITADKLDVDTLSAITGNIGELTAGIIRNLTNTINMNFNATGNSVFLTLNGAPRIWADGYVAWNTNVWSGVLTFPDGAIQTAEWTQQDYYTQEGEGSPQYSNSVRTYHEHNTIVVVPGLTPRQFIRAGQEDRFQLSAVFSEVVYSTTSGGRLPAGPPSGPPMAEQRFYIKADLAFDHTHQGTSYLDAPLSLRINSQPLWYDSATGQLVTMVFDFPAQINYPMFNPDIRSFRLTILLI